MKVSAVLLAAACLAVAASEVSSYSKDVLLDSANSERIMNGSPATAGQIPYMVGLRFKRATNNFFCGGSIIDNYWVLTAKQCTTAATSVDIFYGSVNRLQGLYTYNVLIDDVICHDTADLCVINTPYAPFGSLVDKITLPELGDTNDYEDYTGIVAGWGKTSDTSTISSVLNWVDVTIGPNSDCSIYASFTPDNICSPCPNPPAKCTCNGDAGGPLVLDDGGYQVGINSFGAAAGCESGKPKGLVRLTSHLEWIKDNTGVYY